MFTLHNKPEPNFIATIATHADLVSAIRHAVAAQDQGTADYLINHFYIGVEPLRRKFF